MELINKVVAVAIGIFVAAIMLPLALVQMANASWYTVNPALVIVCTILLPVLGVIAIAMYFLRND